MNLDQVASALCAWIAAIVFALWLVSSPGRKAWLDLPPSVRRGLLLTGAMFTWRAVNFASLAPQPEPQRGQINAEGVLASAALAYLVTALALWVVRRQLPGLVFDRLRFAEKAITEDPDLVPVMLRPTEVIELSRAQGLATLAPNAGAQEVPPSPALPPYTDTPPPSRRA